jgi:hypothetical protein
LWVGWLVLRPAEKLGEDVDIRKLMIERLHYWVCVTGYRMPQLCLSILRAYTFIEAARRLPISAMSLLWGKLLYRGALCYGVAEIVVAFGR